MNQLMRYPIFLACLLAASGALGQAQLLAVDQAGAAIHVADFDVTPDGRYVVYASFSALVVPGDVNGHMDVFRRDRQTGATVMVSTGPGGVLGNGPSFQAAISADGRFVAFASEATNLVANDTNASTDVFLRDMELGTTTLVSANSAGVPGNAPSNSPQLSDDGRIVAFTSFATNLDARATAPSLSQVFARDTVLGTTAAISVTTGGVIANGVNSCLSITGDGRQVLFTSTARNLGGPPDDVFDLFLHDLASGTTRILSTDPSGFLPFSGGSFGALSRDGRYAVLGITRTGTDHVVVSRADLFTGWVDFVSRDTFGNTRSDEFVRSAAISADGRWVAWSSARSDYVPSDTNGANDVFVRDMTTGTTRRMNFGPDAVEANPEVSGPGELVVLEGGREVAFLARSTNLGPANPGLWAAFLSAEPSTDTHDLAFLDLQQRGILLGDMAGSRVLNWEWATQRPGINWVARGTGDFSADGKHDVLVQNTVTRELWVGIMDREVIQSWSPVSQTPNPGWRVAGVGDFTGDGRAAILFQHVPSRRMTLAIMRGATVVAWRDFTQVPNSPWAIAAIGDLNLDGFADILFQHGPSNRVSIAYCRGAQILSWAFLDQTPSPGWRLRATGHFGGGPGVDLVFQREGTGALTIAFCANNVVQSWADVTAPGDRYRLIGAGPF
jgi:Tol biopolymer transport system component